ncbi:hypothetical protein [Pseudoclavibacter helvolus]|uniref:hypothetical protein n=1 Tax=Pseudoclavibacter helvolus TaxID=255205 RepID=UPI003C742F31
MNRRSLLSAWSVPVVAVAVAAPLAAASVRKSMVCVDTAGTYEINGNILTIRYRVAPDIYEVNARGSGWSKSYGTNYGTAPKRGATYWEIELPGPPTWIQCHGFNAHYGESSCPVR